MIYTNEQVALSNVPPRGAGLKPLSALDLYTVSPLKTNVEGESVRYALDTKKQWYVLRVTYNRIKKAVEAIDLDDAEVYLPLHYVTKVVRGKKRLMKKPLLPNILFVYTTEEYIKTVVKKSPPHLHCLTFYYNHFVKDKYGNNPPLTVRYNEMMNFIKVTSIDNEHIIAVDVKHCHYKSGDLVKIIDGDFAGVIGKVARVSGQQRVVVELENLCMIATAYIPTAFIEPLRNHDE